MNGGGVALLVHGLSHPDADVTTCCTEMLARLTSKGVSQIDVSVGYQQIRCEKHQASGLMLGVVLVRSVGLDVDILPRCKSLLCRSF